jgi:uncharacterized OsmC-like protein/TusA-related sulfurtransferase
MTANSLPEPDATCDGGDLDCGSGLLLIIRSAMAPLRPGGTLLVKSRETSVREDLPAWCRLVGHTLLDERAADGGYVHFLLEKKRDDDALATDLQRAREHVWQVRARWTGGMQAKVSMRNHGVVVGQPASFDTADPAPSAVELLLAAAASALATGLQWRLSRQGVQVDNLEVVCKARCEDPLVFLGVAAADGDGRERGSARLAGVDVAAYVAADCEPPLLETTWADTLQRCPVTQTLLRGVPVTSQLRTT